MKNIFDVLLIGLSAPLCLTFVVMLTGFCLGKIKIRGISFGLSGVLITAVLTGVAISSDDTFHKILYSDDLISIMNFLSSFGTALFVSSVAVSSGYEIIQRRTSPIKYVILGAGTVISNFMIMYIIAQTTQNTDLHFLYGIFCGAMTSTPGLSALCETADHSIASVGYSVAYLIGVLTAVLFVQAMLHHECKIGGDVLEHSDKNKFQPNMTEMNGIMQLSSVIAAGIVIGSITIGKNSVSLGNAGGILLCGLLVGAWSASGNTKKYISKDVLGVFHNLGLMIFFVGNGVSAGMKFTFSISISTLLCSLLFACIPIAVGYLIIKYFMKKSKYDSLAAVCGIMTSTPAFGIFKSLVYSENYDSTAYSASYIGALLSMVITMRIVA